MAALYTSTLAPPITLYLPSTPHPAPAGHKSLFIKFFHDTIDPHGLPHCPSSALLLPLGALPCMDGAQFPSP